MLKSPLLTLLMFPWYPPMSEMRTSTRPPHHYCLPSIGTAVDVVEYCPTLPHHHQRSAHSPNIWVPSSPPLLKLKTFSVIIKLKYLPTLWEAPIYGTYTNWVMSSDDQCLIVRCFSAFLIMHLATCVWIVLGLIACYMSSMCFICVPVYASCPRVWCVQETCTIHMK